MWSSSKWLLRANEASAAETAASGSEKVPLLRTDSFDQKLEKTIESQKREVILAKRHRVLILARILLALPGPAFLVFSVFHHFEITTVTEGWALSAPITQIETGRNFALAVGLTTAPLWILSLLIAQIENAVQKFANGSRVCVKRQAKLVELEKSGSGRLLEADLPENPAQKFANGSRVYVKSGEKGEKTSIGYVKEYDEKKQVYTVESFGNVKVYDAKKKQKPYTVELEKIGSGTLVEAEEADIAKNPAQKFAKGSRVCVKSREKTSDVEREEKTRFGYVKDYDEKKQVYTVKLDTTDDNFGEAELELEKIGSGTLVEAEEADVSKNPAQKLANGSRVRVKSGEKTSLGYVREYDEKKQEYKLEQIECGEGSMRDATPVISCERLVRLWNYFLSLWEWDRRIWTRPKAFEAALFFGCVYGYAILYLPFGALFFFVLFAPFVIALLSYMVTKIVQSIIDYQYNQKAEYHTFVNLQAIRLSIVTIFGICLTVYALSAMSRVSIPSNLVGPFVELSLTGITCTDRDAFWTAFEASAVSCDARPSGCGYNASLESFNATCHARPNCGYVSFESLCQAVQYAPMVQAEGVDLVKVLLFNWLGWLLGSLFVFGTGRASLNNGYAHLLSKHMLVAMVLGLGQFMSACYSLVRLLTLVPMLRLPRPAAYFDEKGLMYWELPFFCYGNTCTYYDFNCTIQVHVLIALALNFDFLKKYATAIGAGDQAAIGKLKEKMKEEGEWSDAAPYFYFLSRQVVLGCKTRSLEPMQNLRDVDHLKKKKIKLIDAFRQAEKEALLAKASAVLRVEGAGAYDHVQGEYRVDVAAGLKDGVPCYVKVGDPSVAYGNAQASSMIMRRDGKWWIASSVSNQPPSMLYSVASTGDKPPPTGWGRDGCVPLPTGFFAPSADKMELMPSIVPLVLRVEGPCDYDHVQGEYRVDVAAGLKDGVPCYVKVGDPSVAYGNAQASSMIMRRDGKWWIASSVSNQPPSMLYSVASTGDKPPPTGWGRDGCVPLPTGFFAPSADKKPLMPSIVLLEDRAVASAPIASGSPVPSAAAEKEDDGIEFVQIDDILFISHRWEEPGRPDVDGKQLQAIQEYLREHHKIKWVWFDYSSMPQKIGGIDTRTREEKAEFELMLAAISDLYLTAQVLILLDGSYASRFWTLTEAWCSMQTATKDGLENSISSTEDADFTGSDVKVGSRCTIKCIHNAAKDTTSKGLVNLVSTQTPEGMHGILEKPDVNVTNAKDKEAILPKILKTDMHVKEGFLNNFDFEKTKNEKNGLTPKSEPEAAEPFSRARFRSKMAQVAPATAAAPAASNQVAPSVSTEVTPYDEP